MSAGGDEHSLDLVRQSLQIHVNEAGAAVDNGDWLVTHYAAVVGLYRFKDDGSVEIRPVLVSPNGQARYITYGLLAEAPELLTELESIDARDCDETD